MGGLQQLLSQTERLPRRQQILMCRQYVAAQMFFLDHIYDNTNVIASELWPAQKPPAVMFKTQLPPMKM